MPSSLTRVPACMIAAAALALGGCQLKSSPVPNGFISADSSFVIHNVNRYDAGQLNGTGTMIVIVAATYTNPDANPETISPDKFQLIDQTLEAVYSGLSGGDYRIPAMETTTLLPGKPVDVTIGFRVPAAMSIARLVYHP